MASFSTCSYHSKVECNRRARSTVIEQSNDSGASSRTLVPRTPADTGSLLVFPIPPRPTVDAACVCQLCLNSLASIGKSEYSRYPCRDPCSVSTLERRTICDKPLLQRQAGQDSSDHASRRSSGLGSLSHSAQAAAQSRRGWGSPGCTSPTQRVRSSRSSASKWAVPTIFRS